MVHFNCQKYSVRCKGMIKDAEYARKFPTQVWNDNIHLGQIDVSAAIW